MNLKDLSDQQLLAATDLLVKREREILTEVLHHLREIERRRLFSSLGYRSLFDYAAKKLGYSEDQAYRRIAAMRMIKELPEIEDKINSGALNLSHLSMAKSLFTKESLARKTFSAAEKVELLGKLENKSAREAQRIVLRLTSVPEAFISEKIRPIADNLTEIKFTVTEDTKSKIERVKGLFAHTHPNMSMAELIDKLCDLAIEQKTATFRKRCVKSMKCENCESTYALEVDHILPRAKGGTDHSENLRTLCRSCNQRAAINEFGQAKMDRYLNLKLPR